MRLERIDTQAQLNAVLGQPYYWEGHQLKTNREWMRRNMVYVELPSALPLSWAPTKRVTRVTCHRLLRVQLEGFFRDLVERDLWDEFHTYGGGFEMRLQRGSTTAISRHAWASAWDFNPEDYPLGSGRDWPAPIIACWHEHAGRNGGEYSGRQDAMHFEFAKVAIP